MVSFHFSPILLGASGPKSIPQANPNGDYTHFVYASSNSAQVVEVDRYLNSGATSGAASVTKFSYPSSTSTKETNPLGGTTTYTLDSSGRVTKVVDPDGHTRSQTWTPNSDVATSTDGAGKVTTNSYDTTNNITKVALPTGAAAQAAYANSSTCSSADTTHPYEAKCTTDASGNTTGVTYDTAGNVLSSKDTTATGSGGTGASTFTYTRQGDNGVTCGGFAGQICSATDGNGNKTTYAYDSTGDLTTVTPPAPEKATTYGYDNASRLGYVTDGNGATTRYTYDAYDRTTQILDGAGAYTKYFYDNNGNTTQSQDSNISEARYWSYDPLNEEVWRYEPSMGDGNSYVTQYDNAGDITSVQDVTGTTSYTYDTAKLLKTLTEPGVSTAATFTEDSNGREISRTLPNGITQATTRDASGRATEIKDTKSSTTLADYTYSYTAASAGNASNTDRSVVQSRTDKTGLGEPAGSVQTYSYDGLDRLTGVVEKTSAGATNASWGYTYDKAGNRLSAVTAGATGGSNTASTASATISYGYNADDELTSKNGSATGWAYDSDGQQTNSPTIGAEAYNTRLSTTSVTPASGTATSFGYDAAGNIDRNSAATGSTSTTYTNGVLGLSTAVTGSGSSATTDYRYTPDGGTYDSAVGSTRTYYLTDDEGSVIALANSSGTLTATYSYDPYGNTRATTGGTVATSNPIRYIGGYYDAATGLYHFNARYYDPTTGRFTQPDPSGLEGNPYSYTGDDPLNSTDLSGDKKESKKAKLASVASQVGSDFFACVGTGGAGAEFSAAIGIGTGVGDLAIAATGFLVGCAEGVIINQSFGDDTISNPNSLPFTS